MLFWVKPLQMDMGCSSVWVAHIKIRLCKYVEPTLIGGLLGLLIGCSVALQTDPIITAQNKMRHPISTQSNLFLSTIYNKYLVLPESLSSFDFTLICGFYFLVYRRGTINKFIYLLNRNLILVILVFFQLRVGFSRPGVSLKNVKFMNEIHAICTICIRQKWVEYWG